MKKLAGIVVILAALILGSYYVMGYLTQRKITESLKGINLTNDLSVSLVDYQLGWFTSDVSFNWQLSLPGYSLTTEDGQRKDIAGENYQLPMPVTVYHGPVIFSDKGVKFGLGYAHTKLALPAHALKTFNDLFTAESIQPSLALTFFVNYLGTSNVDVSLPPFKLFAKQGVGEFDWFGLHATTHFFPRTNQLDGNVKLDGVQFTQNQLRAVFSPITSKYDLHETSMGYYLGDAKLSFPSLRVSHNNDKLWELSQFEVDSNSDIVDNLFNMNFAVTIDKLFIASLGNYGPTHLNVGIRNLDAQALVKIDNEIKKAQQNSNTDQENSLLSLMNQVPKILGKGAEFEIKQFNFVTPEGKVDANLLITFPKYDVPTLFNLLNKVKAHGKLALPEDVLKKALIAQENLISMPSNNSQGTDPSQQVRENLQNDQQKIQKVSSSAGSDKPQQVIPVEQRLSNMVKSGLMRSDGNSYTIEIQYDQGNLLVNGQPFDAKMLDFDHQ